MRILVLGGAGAMASGTVRDLISPHQEQISRVVVADRLLGPAQALVDSLGDPRLSAVEVDVADAEALAHLLADCDLCINAVPTFAGQQMVIFDACRQAGRPYVDYGGMGVLTVEQKKHHAAWAKAGVTAVLGLGADPGISNMVCRAVAERLDQIDRINLFWVAKNFGAPSPVLVPPYSLATLLAEYANPSQQFLEGRLQEVGPRSGQEVLILPEPWGQTEFMYTQHSEPLTVPFSQGIRDKGIREFTWKLHLPEHEHRSWLALCSAGFDDYDEPINVQGQIVKPLDLLDALIRRNIERRGHLIPESAIHELHLAIGEGMIGGQSHRINCAVIGGPNPAYAGFNDPATSIGLAIGVQLMLRGGMRPGVWAPEECFETAPFFAELRRRHFTVVEDLPLGGAHAPTFGRKTGQSVQEIPA
ncbi:MAG TPA: saccharopine dehydrogenase NADP-binding domain-containing protein [Acidisoma sp.]|uniref:saccharopine dehydrogenase family protein n=1 Tax=Acidisoma sp. TaxID=1872115 RepID=UPI002B623737|nr:saccharopine dehydrogenase NADP-binding domain-containing protein [Acidisoma sp.]HTH99392.1 saccharopine dehydrogenase NADP-binding domain-containing protein [Acidisoma sp.]